MILSRKYLWIGKFSQRTSHNNFFFLSVDDCSDSTTKLNQISTPFSKKNKWTELFIPEFYFFNARIHRFDDLCSGNLDFVVIFNFWSLFSPICVFSRGVIRWSGWTGWTCWKWLNQRKPFKFWGFFLRIFGDFQGLNRLNIGFSSQELRPWRS